MVTDPPIQQQPIDQSGFFGRVWSMWFSSIKSAFDARIRNDGSFIPPSLADSTAENNSIYYSTTQSKLVYKDASGTVNDLY